MNNFWTFANAQPNLTGILFLLTLFVLALILGGRAVERTKQTVAYADAESRVAEAKARTAEADASARKAEARVAEINATVAARREGVTVEVGPRV